MGALKDIVTVMDNGLFNIPLNVTLLQEVLGRELSDTQVKYLEDNWSAFSVEPEKYSSIAELINKTLDEKGIA